MNVHEDLINMLRFIISVFLMILGVKTVVSVVVDRIRKTSAYLTVPWPPPLVLTWIHRTLKQSRGES